MADEEDCLKRLVQQKCHRPMSSRISLWETNPPDVAKHKRKKKNNKARHQNLVDSNSSHSESEYMDREVSLVAECSSSVDDSSDSECVYYSAEESHVTELGPKESDSSDTDLTDDGTDSIDKTDDEIISSVNSKRAPSKKQKRKKRMKMKMNKDDFFNLMLIDALVSLDLNDTIKTIKERSISVHKSVPSLAELCIRCRRSIISEDSIVCKSLRKLYTDVLADCSFNKQQLTWVFHVLSCSEPPKYMKKTDEILYPTNIRMDQGVVILRACRNIWNPGVYIKDNTSVPSNVITDYPHISSLACLPHHTVTQYIHCDSQYDMLNTQGYRCMQSLLSLSIYCTAIDLMLPGTYKQSKSNRCNIKCVETAKIRVKNDLQNRFPVGTKACFDLSMPYVYWARGEIKMATYSFFALIQKEKRDRFKALHLNELARMYAHIGMTDLAARFYRIAGDAVSEKSKNDIQMYQITGQTQMLLANLNDQGLMTQEKARNSRSFWKSINTSPNLYKQGSELIAIEALLCFHGYWWTDDTLSWLQVAVDWLLDLVKTDDNLTYHLGCVYGFMGNFEEAERILKWSGFYFPQNKTVPRNIVLTKHQKQWACLASCDKYPTHHMKVMWRTQLCHPLFSKESEYKLEAEFCNEDLNLRMTSDGCITGDMQMVLPPIRAVCLNPYTGYLSFNSVQGRTEDWKYNRKFSTIDLTNQRNSDDELFYIHTPYELYNDEDGVKVHLVQPRSDHFWFPYNGRKARATHSMLLVWKNLHGQKQKLSLFKKIQDVLYKKTETEILIENSENPLRKELLLNFLELFYKKGWRISKRECEMKMKKFKDVTNITKNHLKFTQKMYDLIPMIMIDSPPVMYGKTLMFIVDYAALFSLRVIVDCTSRDTFCNPVIDVFDYRYPKRKVEISDNLPYRTIGADIAWSKEWEGQYQQIILFDQKGEKIDKFPVKEILNVTSSANPCHLHIMGDNLLYVNDDKSLCVRKNKENSIVSNFNYVTKVIVINSSLCIIMEALGICVYNIQTKQVMKFKVDVEESIERDMLDTDEHVIHLHWDLPVSVLKMKRAVVDSVVVNKIVLAVETFLLVLQVADQPTESDEVHITTALHLPGYPTDFCFVNHHVGFLVTWTHYKEKRDINYREHLFHFSSQGQLLGILPFLGRSPFSFFTTYLDDDTNIQQKYPGYGMKGWYVYMRDGHAGILCVKLMD